MEHEDQNDDTFGASTLKKRRCAMSIQPFSNSWVRTSLFGLLLAVILPGNVKAQLVVDCTGATPGTFPSINAALPSAAAGTFIIILAGPCNESVQLSGYKNLFLGTYYGFPNVAINGGINVTQSQGVYLHGLDITNAWGDGINVQQSQALVLDACTANGNAGSGLNLGSASEAQIIAPASFDGNNSNGVRLFGNAYVEADSWNGQSVDVSNNHGSGVWSSQSSFTTLGRTSIANNGGFGVEFYGGTKGQFGSLSGPNSIIGNQQGGVSLQENAEISLFNLGSQTYIQNNGPVGVTAGFGSQVTLYDQVDVSGHSGPAVDLYANSQARLFGANNIHNNGVAGDPRSAAIRVDGNSEAFLRGGTVTQNIGPAILVLVSSSVDFTGVSFSSNSGGIVVCDSSAYMLSDLANGTPNAPAVNCSAPHALGNRAGMKLQPMVPDISALKALQAKMKAKATKH
jgi:hypothetical protein